MATYVYGSYQTWTQIYVRFRAWFAYSISSTDTTYSITVYAGPQLTDNTGTVQCSLSCKLTGTGQSTRSTTKTFSTDSDDSSKRMTFLSSKKWTWDKTSEEQEVTIKATVDRSNMTASTVSKTFTIPALTNYPVSYYDGENNLVRTDTKYLNKDLTLWDGSGLTKDNNVLDGWNTLNNGTGTAYELGSTYTANSSVSLYAQWSETYTITKAIAYRGYGGIDVTSDESAVSGKTYYDYETGSTNILYSLDISEGTIKPDNTDWYEITGTKIRNSDSLFISFDYDKLTTTDPVTYSITVGESVIASGTLPQTRGTIVCVSEEDQYSVDTEYTIVISLGNGAVTKTINVPLAIRPLDIIRAGDDISMGIMSPAEVGTPLKLTPNVSIDSNGNITINNYILNDWVIERGTNGDWTYEKWKSGKVEAWGSYKTDTLSMSSIGNVYRVTNISVSIPSGIFSEKPSHAQVFAHYSAAVFISASCSPQSETSLSCQIIKATNNDAYVTLHFHCVYYPSDY